jgi:hypothetical protein
VVSGANMPQGATVTGEVVMTRDISVGTSLGNVCGSEGYAGNPLIPSESQFDSRLLGLLQVISISRPSGRDFVLVSLCQSYRQSSNNPSAEVQGPLLTDSQHEVPKPKPQGYQPAQVTSDNDRSSVSNRNIARMHSARITAKQQIHSAASVEGFNEF